MLCPASYQYLNMHTLHLSKITKNYLMPVLLFLAGNKILFCHKPTLVIGPIFSYSLMSGITARLHNFLPHRTRVVTKRCHLG